MNGYNEEFVCIHDKCVISNHKVGIRNVSLSELILEKLNENPEKEVLIDCEKNKVWKAKEIVDSILKLTSKFIEVGVKKGEIIAVQAPNSDYQVFAYFAAVAVGAVYTGCMHNAPTNELEKVIKETNPSYLILSQDKLQTYENVRLELKNVKKVFVVDIEDHTSEFISIPKSISEVECVDKNHLKDVISGVNGDDPLQIVFSSGSTGLPKPVLLSHRNLTADFETTRTHYNMINSEDIVALYFPLYHTIGSAILSFCFYAAAKCCVFIDDTNEKIYEMCHKYKVTSIYIVPSLVNAFNEMFSEEKMLSLKKVTSTGDCLPLHVANRFVNNFKIEYFTQLYGSSEIGTGTVNPYSSGVTDLKSVGFPVFESICKVVDIDANKDLDANEIGEIRIKSPQVFKGYLNNKNATQRAFDENGFYKTGDAGYYDKSGRFYFVGRYSSLIKHDSWCVSPLELESILLEHECVQEAAVVGIDAGILGEVPKAFVILRDVSVTKEELLEFVNSKVVYYKQLQGGIEFLEEFPRTSIGKIDRKALLEYKFSSQKCSS